jgi:hypothetical protein
MSTSSMASARSSTRVRHGLAHLHVCDLRDHVVQALDVLHVDGREHIDARGEQLLDVLPALGVTPARRVGVRELVEQQQRRSPGEGERRGRTPRGCGRGTRPADGATARGRAPSTPYPGAVRLDEADDHVEVLLAHQVPRDLKHAVGLADPRGEPEEDLELAPLRAGLFGLHRRSSASGSGRSSPSRSVMRGAPQAPHGRQRVERPVEPQDVHARARRTDPAYALPCGRRRVRAPSLRRGRAPGDASGLKMRGRRRDVGVEAAAGGRDEVDGNRDPRALRMGCAQRFDAAGRPRRARD